MSTRYARRGCDRFLRFPGSVRINAGEGSRSRFDRRSTRVAGLDLTPVPSGAESSRRERDRGVVESGRVLQSSEMDAWRNRESGCRSSLRCRARGRVCMEWYGRSQAGVNQERSTAPSGWGSHTERPRAWLRRNWCSRRSDQATDVTVAQSVEDQREEPAVRQHASVVAQHHASRRSIQRTVSPGRT